MSGRPRITLYLPVEGVVSHPVLSPQSDSSHTDHGEDATLSLLVQRVDKLSAETVHVRPQ